MKRIRNVSLAAMLLLLSAPAAFGQSALLAEGLRTEYLVDPLGIDVEQPRLSWTLSSARKRREADRLPGPGRQQSGQPG